MTPSGSEGAAPAANTKRSDWKKPLIACLLVAVVALAGLSVYQQQQITKVSNAPPPLQWCPGNPVWNLETNSSAIPILWMDPNSTGYACVVYQTTWQGNATAANNLGIRPAGGNASSAEEEFQPYRWQTGLAIADVGCAENSPPSSCISTVEGRNNFRIKPSPSSVELTATTDYFRVMYTITALANSTGYYNSSVPYGCSSMWMVVGQPASPKPSDFGTEMCPVGAPFMIWDPSPVSVSVIGLGATYNYPF